MEDESVPNGSSGRGNGKVETDLREVAEGPLKAAIGQRVSVGEETDGRWGEGPGRAL